MIFFADPRPDELLYSSCARYSDTMSYPNNYTVKQELFGSTRIKAVIDFPSHLNELISVLPTGHHYTVDSLIDKNTLLPLYSGFLPLKRYENIRSEMMGSRKQGVHLRLGLVASHLERADYLPLCRECVKSDRANFGTAHWHRSHFVPGIKICPIHGIWLEKSVVKTQGQHEFISAESIIGDANEPSLDIALPVNEDLIAIARGAFWLLENPQKPFHSNELSQRYLSLLTKYNLATYSGRVRTSRLVAEFKERFSDEFLVSIGCQIEERSPRNWLTRIAQKDYVQNPIRHVLMMRFFGITPQEFFNQDGEMPVFGVSPWPCLNPICSYFRKPVIQAIHIGRSHKLMGRPLGTFRCDHCGYTYTRIGPDKAIEDSFQINRVVVYGNLWDELLQKLWTTPKMTTKEIAKTFGVSHDTIRKHAMRLGLPEKHKYKTRHISKRQNKVTEVGRLYIEDYRAIWLKEIRTLPNVTLAKLIKHIPQVYRTLYRYDTQWLAANKPVVSRKGQQSPKSLNWNERDLWLVEQIHSVVEQLMRTSDTGGLTRITINSIAVQVGLRDGTLQRDLLKMPLSRRAISEVVESHEQFAIRRINYVGQMLMDTDNEVNRSTLIKRTGLSKAVQTPYIISLIEEWSRKLDGKKAHNIC